MVYGLKFNRLRLVGCFIGIMAFVFLFCSADVLAVARGYYSSDTGLQTGMVVALRLDSSTTSSVERAGQASNDRVVGVVTTTEASLITVSSGSANVLVESEGQVEAYVSNIGGQIKKGDLLVLSPLKGILMKADQNNPANVIAVAVDSVTGSTSYGYEDNGHNKQTQIAKILVNVNHPGGGSTISVPESSITRIGKSLAGREIGETRVLLAMILFFIVLIAEGGVLYGAVSSALSSLGRNPLAGKIIRNEMLRVVGIAFFVLVIGLAAVYGLLRI